MIAIAIYALHHQIISVVEQLSVLDQANSGITQVPGKDDFFALPTKLKHRRTQNVTSVLGHYGGLTQSNYLVILHRLPQSHGLINIGLLIKG
jgi:hypothetical protein